MILNCGNFLKNFDKNLEINLEKILKMSFKVFFRNQKKYIKNSSNNLLQLFENI